MNPLYVWCRAGCRWRNDRGPVLPRYAGSAAVITLEHCRSRCLRGWKLIAFALRTTSIEKYRGEINEKVIVMTMILIACVASQRYVRAQSAMREGQPQTPAGSLDEVVVTAQKRGEDFRNVPIASAPSLRRDQANEGSMMWATFPSSCPRSLSRKRAATPSRLCAASAQRSCGRFGEPGCLLCRWRLLRGHDQHPDVLQQYCPSRCSRRTQAPCLGATPRVA